MDTEKTEKKGLPPYLPHKTFKSFMDTMEVTPPSRIDRSVMPTLSGTLQSWLIAALKYLKLVKEDGTTEERLVNLVSSRSRAKKDSERNPPGILSFRV